MESPSLFIHPERQKPRLKPLKAWKHMQNLIADKEDTAEVFHIIESLNGDSLRKDLEQFIRSPNARSLMDDSLFLPDLLDDHVPLWDLPSGSVGRTYVEFMEREGLTAHGLVEESKANRATLEQYDDDLLWYANRLRDTHDMYHILTGYGRDALGEASLLGFTHSQHGGLGISFIAYMGQRQIAKHVPRTARISDVIAEGRRNGKKAKRIIEQDIVALLPRQLDEVRSELGIERPTAYYRALKIFEDEGIMPALVAA